MRGIGINGRYVSMFPGDQSTRCASCITASYLAGCFCLCFFQSIDFVELCRGCIFAVSLRWAFGSTGWGMGGVVVMHGTSHSLYS